MEYNLNEAYNSNWSIFKYSFYTYILIRNKIIKVAIIFIIFLSISHN